MGSLLPEQTTPENPPFSTVGVDFFGPLNDKHGRPITFKEIRMPIHVFNYSRNSH
ncbi:hypothetical protein DPMN_158853 [Dreissena polymorpha]|uniref:Uncharacterized protein n=1 Tax=Dreissena polymorpha TaxID=45954 RepID=A0A9D4EJW9_DREPO|nr:hypothetical protein DPMN_158853 [Dreissena polymorpha]